MKQSNILLQLNFLVCRLIKTYQVYVSIDVVQFAFPWWQLQGWWQQILNIFISLCLWVSFWGSGAIFWAARTSLLLKQNHYNIGTFNEKSFVGNYISNSLHLTLAVVTYSHCRQKTHSEICSVNEIHVCVVSEVNGDVARRKCIVQRQDGFPSKI